MLVFLSCGGGCFCLLWGAVEVVEPWEDRVEDLRVDVFGKGLDCFAGEIEVVVEGV